MIYCVVPRELGEEAFARLVEHYKGNDNVTVIFERRHGDRRRDSEKSGGSRTVRDRRQRGGRGTADIH